MPPHQHREETDAVALTGKHKHVNKENTGETQKRDGIKPPRSMTNIKERIAKIA